MTKTMLSSIAALSVLAACGGTDDGAVETETADMSAESVEDPMAEEAGVTLATAEHEALGRYLVDGEGRSLYILEGGEEGENEELIDNDCTDRCAEEWPPFTTTGDPQAGEGLDPDLLSSVVRQDSTRQVTYADMPLYYYHDDAAAGDTEGQDVHDAWGSWYLMSPDGDAI